MNRRQLSLSLSALAGMAWAPGVRASVADSLRTAIDGPWRSQANRVRDRFRHPAETLAFWGLSPGMTVIEVEPSGGYWTEILAPYLKATGGRYIGAIPGDAAAFAARFSDAGKWGSIATTGFGPTAGPLSTPGSADLVITARNIHDWMWTSGLTDKIFGDFHSALKVRGVLGVEEHRADPRPMIGDARDGYVSVAAVKLMAGKAGFVLDGSSEINANPKDTKDYRFGVWTLPPTLRTHNRGEPTPAGFDPARYPAIGESDRMTLRFRKA